MGNEESRPRRDSDVPVVEEKFDPKELIRMMNEHPGVVVEYYNSNRRFIEKYIVENFWEEDVEEWLVKIRGRSPAEELQVRKIDFLKEKNEVDHHTSLYENDALVVRRAAEFEIDVLFGNRQYDPDRDDLTLVFSAGSKPSEAVGTKLVCPVATKPGESGSWHCYVVRSDDKKLTVRVNVPVTAIVALYKVSVDIVSGTSEGRRRSEFTDMEHGVIVLFNPFVTEDTVYMADESQRDEYVMNSTGFIATGNWWSIGRKTWHYAQFDAGVLNNVLMMIVNDSRHVVQPVKSWKKRNDPVYLSRVLSAMVNTNDDRGVLRGRWDGNYDDARSPGWWSNSGVILKQWADSGMKPVKYGQCWVFAGVLCTALRALGIPARCISNFASAHDTNSNVTVDMYYDADTGDKLDESSDTVWNFHVWNEAFFRRPDLQAGYDGWQVVDATPQEVSDVVDPLAGRRQLFQCGPAPVKAIKEGEINVGLDGNFIFGEVNADMVNWSVKDRKVTTSEVLKRHVGRNISTKAVGSNDRAVVTNEYKYDEGTEEERVAFYRAYGRGTRDHSVWGIRNPDVLVKPKYEVEIVQAEEAVFFGSKVSTTIKVKNVSDAQSEVSIKVFASSKRHVGSIHAVLKQVKKTVKLDAGKAEEFVFEVDHPEYMLKIVDNKVVNVRVVATDTKDGNTKIFETDVQFEMPECITTNAPATVPRDVVTKFDVIFENKLPITLTKGVVEVHFRGNKVGNQNFTVEKPIAPGEKYTVKDVSVSPLSNWGQIYATIDFDCVEVKDIQYTFGVRVA